MSQPDHTAGAAALPMPPVQEPFHLAIEGYATREEWANTVSVAVVAVYDPPWEQRPGVDEDDVEVEWAADYAERQLVRVDTNYKPSRPGPYPVDLSRVDAVRLAAGVLGAIGDTFHHARVGELRAAEAAELLCALHDIECALDELRGHALGDLLRRVGLDPWTGVPAAGTGEPGDSATATDGGRST